MKLNKFLFCSLVLPAFFNISCLKNKDNLSEAEDEKVQEHIVVESFVEGKILSKSASLCLLGRDSAMHPVIKLSTGTNISVLQLDGNIDVKCIPDEETDKAASENAEKSTGGEIAESSEASNKIQDGCEYVHVVHDNVDFWLEKNVFALNCENAVAIEKLFLYSDAELLQKLDSPQNPMKFATRFAKARGGDKEEVKSVKIFYYDTALKSVREAYVSAASISSREDDIVVSQIAESLKTTKRAVPRNELFSQAARYKPCQKVLAVLNEQKVEKKTYNYQEVLKSMQRMSFGVNVEELLTVDQSKDPFQ